MLASGKKRLPNLGLNQTRTLTKTIRYRDSSLKVFSLPSATVGLEKKPRPVMKKLGRVTELPLKSATRERWTRKLKLEYLIRFNF